jgi:hypothetical protein
MERGHETARRTRLRYYKTTMSNVIINAVKNNGTEYKIGDGGVKMEQYISICSETFEERRLQMYTTHLPYKITKYIRKRQFRRVGNSNDRT